MAQWRSRAYGTFCQTAKGTRMYLSDCPGTQVWPYQSSLQVSLFLLPCQTAKGTNISSNCSRIQDCTYQSCSQDCLFLLACQNSERDWCTFVSVSRFVSIKFPAQVHAFLLSCQNRTDVTPLPVPVSKSVSINTQAKSTCSISHAKHCPSPYPRLYLLKLQPRSFASIMPKQRRRQIYLLVPVPVSKFVPVDLGTFPHHLSLISGRLQNGCVVLIVLSTNMNPEVM